MFLIKVPRYKSSNEKSAYMIFFSNKHCHIIYYYFSDLNQRKESLLLDLTIVPPPPKTNKLCVFFDQFINSLSVTILKMGRLRESIPVTILK